MSLRWDALLARELARELDDLLSGARLRALRMDGDRRDAVFHFRELTLAWRLHPTRGTVTVHDPTDPAEDALRLPYRVRRVHAPADERMVVFELLPLRGGRRAVDAVVELLGNQWNCLVTEGDERILRHVLHTRTGSRVLRVGQAYEPPPPSGREGVDGTLTRARWDEIVLGAAPAERRRTLVSRVAWTSPVNAPALLPPPEGPEETETGYALWRSLVDAPDGGHPVVLDLPRGRQPYPLPLPGVASQPTESLLDGFARVAADSDDAEALERILDPALFERLEREVELAQRRVVSLVAELDALDDPTRLRSLGDLLLARFHDVPPGAPRATLEDFEGNPVTVELEPGASPQESAARYYDRAARAERAGDRLPGLLEQARNRARALEDLLERAREGDASASEIEGELPAPRARADGPGQEPSLPYRRFRSSGGLEIRVGRGSRHNDDLTFHHSSPDDLWLHARHASGAHVILRWRGPGNPPKRDLSEAAVLAALHSKARSSGSVPVDYTLRKYVRKPRRSPPGSVIPDRVKTIFVEPNPDLMDSLRDE